MNSIEVYLSFYFIIGDINLESIIFFQNLTTWVKSTLANIYNQFPYNSYTHQMMTFASWTIIFNNEVLLALFTYPYFISGSNNLERVIMVQNITSWVKFTLDLIYNQFPYTDFNHRMMIYESSTWMVINELLWVLFTHSSFFSGDINYGIFPFTKPHNLGQIPTSTSL